ncbi:MAG: tryptophan synthase subunit alpha [Desulfurivibrionaceae bacterium]
MGIESRVREALEAEDILIMTHIVLGYPSLEANEEIIRDMVTGGVNLIEMQIPFSEPVADGPVIVRANQSALTNGIRVKSCLDFAARITRKYKIPFLFMTYYNVIFKYGPEKFLKKAEECGVQGLIIPDLPPEEGEDFFAMARTCNITPIMLFSPTSSLERMKYLAGHGEGFIYCVARRGVTGSQTSFDEQFNSYIGKCREATNLPLAVGFGISSKEDIAYLKGKAEIGVIGTKTIKLMEEEGTQAVGPFIKSLKQIP